MKNKETILCLVFLFTSIFTFSQDTFSIVALDSITGEVGSAGASCVDMNNFPNYETDFLGELFPSIGAINTQAWYLAANQANARNRMNLGDTPSEIIQWLQNNDVGNQPQKRQYGIVAMVDGSPQSAGFTGSATDDYKNHITGPNYSIQGNILLGQEVLDSMEARFLREEGDLACKLMAALQGAKMPGADSRCFSNGTSSLFAFIKVAQPDDIFGSPSFLLSVKTSDGQGIEPIDTLQVLFEEQKLCTTVNLDETIKENINIYPNPASKSITFDNLNNVEYLLQIIDNSGKLVFKSNISDNQSVDVSQFKPGIFLLRFSNNSDSFTKKIVIK